MRITIVSARKIVAIVLSLALVSGLFLAVRFSGASDVISGNVERKLPIYRVKTDEKKIAISFDCAWGTDYTDTLLSVMEKENVKSTFFMVEFWTVKHGDYVKKIVEHGHEIGTHSKTHPEMSKLDRSAIESELKSSSLAIENITGKKVELFRAPFGDYDDLLIETAKDLGLFTIQWDVDSLDWKDLSASEITERVVKNAKEGSIVLFHNQGKHTAEALPGIIAKLKDKGFTFVSIGELIYRDNYKILPNGEQIKL